VDTPTPSPIQTTPTTAPGGAPIDLADPTFEPTDEDLIGLSQRAFADVKAQNAEMLRKLRERIRAPHTPSPP
jgi:hypothetical protein